MENLFIIAVLAVGLAMDAFAVAVAQGAAGYSSRVNAVRLGLAFGFAQGIMPLIGWQVGTTYMSQIKSFDHWIALILLCALGTKMIWEARGEIEGALTASLSGWALLLSALATSIDALAAGVTLPTLGLPAVQTCIAIGIITGLLSAFGVSIGGIASKRIGKVAVTIGGVILIILGVKIFVEHQFFGA